MRGDLKVGSVAGFRHGEAEMTVSSFGDSLA